MPPVGPAYGGGDESGTGRPVALSVGVLPALPPAPLQRLAETRRALDDAVGACAAVLRHRVNLAEIRPLLQEPGHGPTDKSRIDRPVLVAEVGKFDAAEKPEVARVSQARLPRPGRRRDALDFRTLHRLGLLAERVPLPADGVALSLYFA